MTYEWAPRFLQALASGCSASEAAASAGITSSSAYARRKRDPDFAAGWADAIEDSADLLEQEARRRAIDGVEEPVYQGGQLVGTKTVYSDSLLALLLKGRRQAVFGVERKELTGPGGAPIAQSIVVATGVPSPGELVNLADLV